MRALIVSLVLAVGALGMAPAAWADESVSSNWAGYAAHGASFRSVWGSWRQPGVTCARDQTAYSAYWVGLGGYAAGAQALEQIGTEADCQNGRPVLSAWYEMVPAASMPVSMPVGAGDLINASVAVSGRVATLVLSDLTRRRSFHTTVWSREIDVSSAEWIVEAPSDCLSTCTTLPLADFGSAGFSASRAQLADGYVGAIADRRWTTTRIRLAPTGRQFVGTRPAGAAVASGLTWGDSVFSVSYVGAAPSYGLRRTRVRMARIVHPLRSGGRAPGARG